MFPAGPSPSHNTARSTTFGHLTPRSSSSSVQNLDHCGSDRGCIRFDAAFAFAWSAASLSVAPDGIVYAAGTTLHGAAAVGLTLVV